MRELATLTFDNRHGAANTSCRDEVAVGRDCDSDDGRRRCFDLGKNLAVCRQEVDLAVRPGCNDLPVGRNRDVVERRWQIADDLTAAC
jgi:hypothetical protein